MESASENTDIRRSVIEYLQCAHQRHYRICYMYEKYGNYVSEQILVENACSYIPY